MTPVPVAVRSNVQTYRRSTVEFHRRHELSLFVFDVCLEVSNICDELITRLEESYRLFVCV